jgi:hypothetical protein
MSSPIRKPVISQKTTSFFLFLLGTPGIKKDPVGGLKIFKSYIQPSRISEIQASDILTMIA